MPRAKAPPKAARNYLAQAVTRGENARALADTLLHENRELRIRLESAMCCVTELQARLDKAEAALGANEDTERTTAAEERWLRGEAA